MLGFTMDHSAYQNYHCFVIGHFFFLLKLNIQLFSAYYYYFIFVRVLDHY